MEYKVGIINIVAVTISGLLLMTPLRDKPGGLHPVLVVPFFYCLFSCIPACVVVFSGIKKIIQGHRGHGYIAVICLNGIYLLWYVIVVLSRWDAIMSV